MRADRTAVGVLALDNLIDNAISPFRRGGHEYPCARSGEADRVRFDVIDRGVGIPAQRTSRRSSVGSSRGTDDQGARATGWAWHIVSNRMAA